MPQVRDMLNRVILVPEKPLRIASLVPSQTELLADLGLDEEVVGITKFCIHPEQWFRTKTRIGGTKSVNISKLKSLQPDLIIANKEENTREQILELEAIAPVWISDIHTLDEALSMIRQLSQVCGKAEAGYAIADQIATGFQKLNGMGPRSVAYGIWRDPWMWAGGDTFIHDMLQHCGLRNVLENVPRYPEVSPEELNTLKPDLVFLSSEPYPFREKHIRELQSALPVSRIILVDGELFSWYGSRLLKTPEYLSGLLGAL